MLRPRKAHGFLEGPPLGVLRGHRKRVQPTRQLAGDACRLPVPRWLPSRSGPDSEPWCQSYRRAGSARWRGWHEPRYKACNLDGRLNGSFVRGQSERKPLPFRLPFVNGSLYGSGSRSGESCKLLFRRPRRTEPVSMTILNPSIRQANGRAKWDDHVDDAPIASQAPLQLGKAPGNCGHRRHSHTCIDHL